MRIAMHIPGLTLFATVCCATALGLNFDGYFNIGDCYFRTLELISNGTLAVDDKVFHRDDAGQPMSRRDKLTVTANGCRQLCGPNQDWYRDIGPRLSSWLIPILLLIINVELSPLDKRRFLAILHLLGDPIDSIWSLIHKIDSWDRCYDLAEEYGGFCHHCTRVIATVLAGFEELGGAHFNPQMSPLVEKNNVLLKFGEWRRTANRLADSRTDEFSRTCLAIMLFFYQLVANFVNKVGGGNTSPIGGRVATVIFLSWLIPTALLSNVIGNFPSRRTCHDILSDFAEKTGVPLLLSSNQLILFSGSADEHRSHTSEYLASLGWSGGIHSFRPWKRQDLASWQRKPRIIFVFLLSISPLCISMTGAFVFLWDSLPLGFNCRHRWLMGIFLAWLASALITWLSWSHRFITGKYHWYLVLAKDAVIAVPSLVVIVLSACGLYNSCYCWTRHSKAHGDGWVLLDTDPFWSAKVRSTFPVVVGVCMGLQVVTFVITVVVLRRGVKLFRLSETLRSEEWKRGRDYKCKCMNRGGYSVRSPALPPECYSTLDSLSTRRNTL